MDVSVHALTLPLPLTLNLCAYHERIFYTTLNLSPLLPSTYSLYYSIPYLTSTRLSTYPYFSHFLLLTPLQVPEDERGGSDDPAETEQWRQCPAGGVRDHRSGSRACCNCYASPTRRGGAVAAGAAEGTRASIGARKHPGKTFDYITHARTWACTYAHATTVCVRVFTSSHLLRTSEYASFSLLRTGACEEAFSHIPFLHTPINRIFVHARMYRRRDSNQLPSKSRCNELQLQRYNA